MRESAGKWLETIAVILGRLTRWKSMPYTGRCIWERLASIRHALDGRRVIAVHEPVPDARGVDGAGQDRKRQQRRSSPDGLVGR
jgi:hypothetical protein